LVRRSTVIAGLGLLVLGLAAANAVKYGVLTEAFFTSHEKLVDGVSKVFSSVLLGVGAVVSYFAFFRSRLFAARADLDIAVTVVDGPVGQKLHVLNAALRNIGSVPIWEPTAELHVEPLGHLAPQAEHITDWRLRRERDGVDRTAVIAPQERILFHATREFDDGAIAVHYEVIVTSAAGDSWHSMTTVPNRATPQ